MTTTEKAAKAHDWTGFIARDEQLPPPGDWLYWMLCAGRGFGKTRTGSETVRQWIKDGFEHVNLIGATADDVRSIMVEGESGILSICPDAERPRYVANTRRLIWPNGAVSLLFSAEEPDRLRGKQSDKLWADEIASWRDPDTWDQALLGLRLGRQPQAVISTTPRPTMLIKNLMKDEKTVVTRGSTYDNKENLAAAFIHTVVKRYEGTRLGRQELNAEVLEDIEGALWSRANIDATRIKREAVPEMRRVVVAIDPAVTSGEKSDETGIVVAGLGQDDHGYILDDASGRFTPIEWARKAIWLAKTHKADRIVAEVNNGGEMVENTIRMVDSNASFRAVHATRGKVVRAEPVSALYEQSKMHHVGSFPMLEDQMCVFTQDFSKSVSGYSPDRVDALVWAITDLMLARAAPEVQIDHYSTRR